MPQKSPEEVFTNAPSEVRDFARKILEVEKEYLLERRRVGIFDRLVALFKQEIPE